jgi:hypothetical protein
MGYSTILDILGSIVVGGFLLLLLGRVNDAAVKNVYNNSEELILQQNLATTCLIIENDFRRIGYCKNYNLIPNTAAILSATDSSISFLTDVNDKGVVNTLKYYLGPTSELASTPNPRDRFLYRVVDNETPVGVNLGVTQFKLVFFDVYGDTIPFPIATPDLTTISTMEINVAVENVYGYGDSSQDGDNMYSSAFWRQIRLAAMNLKER